MKKIKCYTMRLGGSVLIDPEIENILETLRTELEENLPEDDTIEFEFGTEYHTQEELNEMVEFDGF